MQSAAPDELIASVLDGIQLEISRWTSGVCRFDGTLSGHFENAPEQDLEGPLPGYLAFDHARMRYEIDRPGWVADPKSIRPVAEASDDGRVMAETMRGRLGKKYADDGVHWTVWQSDQPLAVIGNPDDFPNRLPNEFGDIRGITLFEPLAIEQSFSLNRMLMRFRDELGKLDKQVVELDESTWELTWTEPDPDGDWATRWRLVVDLDRGFTPRMFACETRLIADLKDRIADADPSELARIEAWRDWVTVWENRTEWTEIDGVRVPQHHEYRLPSGPLSVGKGETMSFDFHWESVNSGVDPDVFTYRGFNLPDDVAVQDVSRGEPV